MITLTFDESNPFFHIINPTLKSSNVEITAKFKVQQEIKENEVYNIIANSTKTHFITDFNH